MGMSYFVSFCINLIVEVGSPATEPILEEFSNFTLPVVVVMLNRFIKEDTT